MKKRNFLTLVFTTALVFIAFSNVKAQETTENQNANQAVRPFKLFQELGLTREQIQQIRAVNQERRPIMQAAQQRWRAANRELDDAIYGDNSTDEQIKELTRRAQFAQSDLLKERTITEYQIRKVLTPDQLIKFRQLREEIRQKLAEKKALNNRQNPNTQRPINRLRNRQNQLKQ